MAKKKMKSPRKLTDLPRPYHTAAMAEIAKQTDRGAAIVGAAYVDLVLREAITARMCNLPDIIELLFENRGPLQDFGARIQLAYALGIYGHAAYADLCIIKEIRNVFAHSAVAMDFDHPDVAKRCSDLWFPKKIRYGKDPMPSTAKERFIRAVELLTDGLYENLTRPKNGLALSPFLMMGPAPAKASAKPKPPQGQQSSP